jgi:hypothetical protein
MMGTTWTFWESRAGGKVVTGSSLSVPSVQRTSFSLAGACVGGALVLRGNFWFYECWELSENPVCRSCALEVWAKAEHCRGLSYEYNGLEEEPMHTAWKTLVVGETWIWQCLYCTEWEKNWNHCFPMIAVASASLLKNVLVRLTTFSAKTYQSGGANCEHVEALPTQWQCWISSANRQLQWVDR